MLCPGWRRCYRGSGGCGSTTSAPRSSGRGGGRGSRRRSQRRGDRQHGRERSGGTRHSGGWPDPTRWRGDAAGGRGGQYGRGRCGGEGERDLQGRGNRPRHNWNTNVQRPGARGPRVYVGRRRGWGWESGGSHHGAGAKQTNRRSRCSRGNIAYRHLHRQNSYIGRRACTGSKRHYAQPMHHLRHDGWPSGGRHHGMRCYILQGAAHERRPVTALRHLKH